jgi:hypothetical protein
VALVVIDNVLVIKGGQGMADEDDIRSGDAGDMPDEDTHDIQDNEKLQEDFSEHE